MIHTWTCWIQVILVIHVGFVVHVGCVLTVATMTNDDIEENIGKKDVDVDDVTAKMIVKCFFGMKTMNRQFNIEDFFEFLEPFDTPFFKDPDPKHYSDYLLPTD